MLYTPVTLIQQSFFGSDFSRNEEETVLNVTHTQSRSEAFEGTSTCISCADDGFGALVSVRSCCGASLGLAEAVVTL